MPAIYDKLGIRFQYPENWLLDESEAPQGEVSFDELMEVPEGEGGQSVTVFSPNGAFWTLVMHPQQAELDRLGDAVITAMRQEYDELDVEPVRESVDGWELQGFNLNFFCLDLTNTTWIRVGRKPDASFVLLCQAEDREFQRVRPVFQAMTSSLLSGW